MWKTVEGRQMLKTLLLAAMFAQVAVTSVRAESLACYTQFGDVTFTRANNTRVLLPYNQCLSYLGRDGAYIRARAEWAGLTAEGRIFFGDVYCSPGRCPRVVSGHYY